MPKISARRQITLPIDLCRDANIGPGDEYDCYVDNYGHITIIKKIAGSAKGILKDVATDKRLSDAISLQSAISS